MRDNLNSFKKHYCHYVAVLIFFVKTARGVVVAKRSLMKMITFSLFQFVPVNLWGVVFNSSMLESPYNLEITHEKDHFNQFDCIQYISFIT